MEERLSEAQTAKPPRTKYFKSAAETKTLECVPSRKAKTVTKCQKSF